MEGQGEPGKEMSANHSNSPQKQQQEETQSTATTVSISRVNFVPNRSVSVSANGNTAVDLEGLELRSGSGGVHGENTRLRRRWEFFPGKNRFYCDGRVMTAPSIRFCVLSFALILLTFSLFIVFDAPFLTQRLSVAIPIVGSILFVSVIVNMVKTSFSDPGILPRASQQEADHLEKSYYTTNFRPPPRTKDIIVNGQVIKSKYCFTCKMFRPPRVSHCGVCDNCVDRFDHHCPFLGNCIGKRNYRSFYAFIVSLSFLAVFVLSASIAHLAMLSKEKSNFLEALRDSPSSAIVILISFFGMWTVIGLTGFHTYLIAVEQTTNEDIKGLFGRANVKNPFSQGNFCQNCCYVLCGPSHPSLIDPRGFATQDFIASLLRKNDTNGIISPGHAPQLTNRVGSNHITSENHSNQHNHGSSFVSGTNTKIFREQPTSAQTVQPIQHQPTPQFPTPTAPASSTDANNGIHPSKPTFSGLPAIPPEEKVLLKGQTRNGRTDYRQTVPESSTVEDTQASQQEALISPSAASTVSLSTMSSNMSTNNDYDTVGSPTGVVGGNGRVPVVNLSNRNGIPTRRKRLFPSSSAEQLDDDGIIDPSDFDDDLDMPSLSNINEIDNSPYRQRNGKVGSASNNNKTGLGANTALTKSTRSLPSTSVPDHLNGGGDINKIHVLESSYPSSSKSSVKSSKAVASSSSSVRSKIGNVNGSSGPGRGAMKTGNNKRNLDTTMQNSPLHLDSIM